MFYRFVLAWLLLVAPCAAATHTVTWTAATGGTYYAYPASSSLGDWATNRVQLTESGAPNEGYYSGTVDDTDGVTWYLFSGATQPSAWNEAIGVQTVLVAADAIAISGDETAASNLEAASDGAGYNLGGGSIVAASVTGDVGGNLIGGVGGNVEGDLNGDLAGGVGASAVGDIADGVWDELTAGHVTAGSFAVRSGDTFTAVNNVGNVATATYDLLDAGGAVRLLIEDVPTTAEFNARTLAAAAYFDPATDTVVNVTTTGSVTGNVGGNVVGSVASVTGAVGSVTGNVTGSVGSLADNGASITAMGWIAAWDAEVESEVNDALVALHLDHLLAADYDPASKPGVSTALLNELVENDGGVSRFTANALEQGPSGGGGGSSPADTRDLNRYPLWQLKRSGTGALVSTNAAYVNPGADNVRWGWNCDIPDILPSGDILSEMTTPTAENADLTLTKLGIDATAAKVEFDVADDATPGTYYIVTEVSTRNGSGPIPIYGKVVIQAAPTDE